MLLCYGMLAVIAPADVGVGEQVPVLWFVQPLLTQQIRMLSLA
jgi:hypothetical protein